VGGDYSRNQLTQDTENLLFKPNLTAAIAGGYDANGNVVAGGAYSRVATIGSYPSGSPSYVYEPALDPFAQSARSPASLANLYGTEVINADSQLRMIDAKIVGSPFDLPAGKFQLALGAATREESLSSAPDANAYFTAQNWVGGTFFNPFSHSRTDTSYYAETRIPVTSPTWNVPGLYALDLTLAGRTEKYSDTGTSSEPKIGLRWQPFDDQLTIRYTYSRAFAVPDLWHEYGPESAAAATSATFFQSNLGVASTDRIFGQSFSYFSGNGNNPNLQPNRAWSRSLGTVISPKALKGFSLSLDYVNIFEKGIPGGIGASNIVSSVNALGSASPYFSAIAVGGIPGTPGATQAPLASPGGIYNLLESGNYQGNMYILDHFINLGGVHEEALDISPQYELHTQCAGNFTVGTTGTWLAHFMVSNLPTLPFYEFAGYSTNTQTEAGSFPHLSFYSTIDWRFHDWAATVGNTYMSSMTDVGAVTNGQTYAPANYLANHPAVTVNYYTSWDLRVAYTFNKEIARNLWNWLKGMELAVGVNDVFNRYGPYAGLSQAATNNYNNVDTSTYSPIGRLFYFQASVKF
jgi:iron complex outermembrane receptor protein